MDSLFTLTKRFCEENPGLNSIMRLLKPEIEIAIKIDGYTDAALVFKEQKNHLLERKAKNFDIEIEVKTEFIRRLDSIKNTSVKELVIEISREILLGHISFSRKSSFLRLFTNGYLKILAEIKPHLKKQLSSLSLSKLISKIRAR